MRERNSFFLNSKKHLLQSFIILFKQPMKIGQTRDFFYISFKSFILEEILVINLLQPRLPP